MSTPVYLSGWATRPLIVLPASLILPQLFIWQFLAAESQIQTAFETQNCVFMHHNYMAFSVTSCSFSNNLALTCQNICFLSLLKSENSLMFQGLQSVLDNLRLLLMVTYEPGNISSPHTRAWPESSSKLWLQSRRLQVQLIPPFCALR